MKVEKNDDNINVNININDKINGNINDNDKNKKLKTEIIDTIDVEVTHNKIEIQNNEAAAELEPQILNLKSDILNPKVSALSLSSIRAKKALEAQLKPNDKIAAILPVEPFTETQMLEQWIKYANRLGEKGYKILESLLLLEDPKLVDTTIIHELPNESSKIDFEGEKHDLLGYLRGKLHNHNITIEIKINEKIELKKAFTVQEKYERLKGLNPNLELLKKTFDLDL